MHLVHWKGVMHMETEKFIVEIGCLARKAFKREIKNFAFQKDVEVDIDETRGIFFSTLRITLRGQKSDVHAVMNAVRNAAASS